MAQLVVSWFICNGRFRVHAINAIGQRRGRIVEVEDVDLSERFQGSARNLQRMVDTLRRFGGDVAQNSTWMPDPNS